MKRSRSRIVAALGFVGVFPALVVAALLAFEFSFPADGLRPRVAAALSDALGCPLTIAGPLHVISSTRPGIEGRDVRLAECRTIRVARASADLVRVRVDLWALFSRDIRLVEVTGVRLKAEVPTDAPLPAAPSKSTPSRWAFAGITRLHISPAQVLVRSASSPPRAIDLKEVEGSARADQPMRLALRGEHGGEAWEVRATTAKLGDAIAGLARWPLDLESTFAGATAKLHGSWTPAPIGIQGELSFKTPAAEQILQAIGATPPKLGSVELSSNVAASASDVRFDAMQFTGPVGTISGEAHASWSGERPKVDVNVASQEIDYAALERWRSAERGPGSFETILERVFERLRAVDGSLTATVAQVKNAPVSLADVHYSTRVEAGHLHLTNNLTADGVPGSLSLDVDARGPFSIDGQFSVKAIPSAAVAQMRDVARIDPHIGDLSAKLVARGGTVRALLEDLRGQVTGKNIRLELPLAGSHHEVRLRTVEFRAGGGQSLRARAAGTLSGEPLELELAGDRLISLLKDESWAAERFRARVGPARLEVSGVIERPLSTRTTRLKFDLETSRVDQLAKLFGDTPLPRVSGSVRGSADTGPDGWRVEAATLALGATRGSGRIAGKRDAPIDATLDLQTLAADELASAAGPSRPDEKGKTNPIPPDMDLSLKVREARYAREAFETVALDARVRDGAVHAPFSFGWAGARIEGTLKAELRKESMRIDGDATARALDLARLPGPLAKRGITGTIDRLAVRAETHGASTAALPENVAFSIEVAKAAVKLPRSDTFPEGVPITLHGKAQATAAAPIDFSIEGTFRGKPFTASGELPPVGSLFPVAKPHAVRVALEYDRTRLEAAGDASIDADVPRFSGTLKLSGDTLHTLADLAGFSARGFGPYSISTSVEADSKQVAARDFSMQLGKSRFTASLSAASGKLRPRIVAKVTGRPVHLEDIGAQALSPDSLEKTAAHEGRGEEISRAALDRDARLLSSALRALDFDLDVGFEELSSAGEAMGRAEMRAKLADGQLSVAPLTVWVNKTKFDAEIDVDVRGKLPQYTVKFEGNGFEYGPMMRALDPKSPSKGTLDLSLDLKSSGAPEELVQHATGTVDILILPEGQLAGRLDVLGAGILRLVMGALDPKSESRLNCVVGSFNVNDGLAKSRVILLDTTQARVAGDLALDFHDRSLSGQLASSSKRPELFSVVPGIEISGSLDEPRIGVSTRSIVVGVLRIWQVPVTFASDWISNKNVAADGTPDCQAAYRNVLH